MNGLAMKAIAGTLAFVLAGSAMAASVQDVAERYRKLVLAVGQHDKDYVDAYYGPPALQEQAVREKRPLAAIRSDAQPHPVDGGIGGLEGDHAVHSTFSRRRGPPSGYPNRAAVTPARSGIETPLVREPVSPLPGTMCQPM